MFQDDVTGTAYLFIEPILDFRVGPAVFQVMDELFFQQVLQLFLALVAFGEIILGRILRRRQPLLDRQGVDELVLPVLDAKDQLTVHGVEEEFQLAAQPFALFPFSLFPLVEPFDDAQLDIAGNFVGVDDAQDLGQGEAGHGRML